MPTVQGCGGSVVTWGQFRCSGLGSVTLCLYEIMKMNVGTLYTFIEMMHVVIKAKGQ